MTMHEVRHGLRAVTFDGNKIGESSTEKILQPTDNWDQMSPRAKQLFLRWSEFTLYTVPPGQEGDLLPTDGGYLYHVVGQSLCYHVHQGGCNSGVKKRAGDTSIYVLPCYVCRPPLLWSWLNEDDDDDTRALVDPDMLVDMESPTHSVYTSSTAAGIAKIIERGRLSLPAQRLLEDAIQNDPGIAAVYASAPPGAA